MLKLSWIGVNVLKLMGIDWKWLEFTEVEWTWLKVIGSDWNLPKMTGKKWKFSIIGWNSLKCSDVCWNWVELTLNVLKLMRIDWKWLEDSVIDWKRLKLTGIDWYWLMFIWKWLGLFEIYWKWLVLTEKKLKLSRTSPLPKPLDIGVRTWGTQLKMRHCPTSDIALVPDNFEHLSLYIQNTKTLSLVSIRVVSVRSVHTSLVGRSALCIVEKCKRWTCQSYEVIFR